MLWQAYLRMDSRGPLGEHQGRFGMQSGRTLAPYPEQGNWNHVVADEIWHTSERNMSGRQE